MKKKIIIMVLMLVTIAFAGCIEEDIVEDEEGDIEDVEEYDGILNVTVCRISPGFYCNFLHCINQIKYEIDFPFNDTIGDYLIGRELTIYVENMTSTYDMERKSTGWYTYKILCDKWVKEYEVIGENNTIRSAYDEYLSYTANLSCFENLVITGNETIGLPILDKHGKHIHHIKEVEIAIYNPCNISTYLITDFSQYDCDTDLALSHLPSELDNRYFILTYPEEDIVIEPYETVCYLFTIEIYGSGAEQIFFPKEYQIEFILRNEQIIKTFSLDVSLIEYD